MNWAAFTFIISMMSLVADICIAATYSMWEYPQYHRTNRNWMIALFIIGTLGLAISIGIWNK